MGGVFGVVRIGAVIFATGKRNAAMSSVQAGCARRVRNRPFSREAQPRAGNFGFGIRDFGFMNEVKHFRPNPNSEIPIPKSPLIRKSTSPDIALGCASRLNFAIL
jgi:hypothetical protein